MKLNSLLIAVFAFLPVVTAAVVCARQSDRLGLFHAYLVLVALSYGSYTVVDVFVTNVESVDVYVAALLLSAICTSMIFMALIFGKLSRVAVYRTSFSSVIVEALGVPLGILILLWSVVVGWHAYAYFEWGIISHYDEVTLRENYFIDIPSWVGPVRHLVIALAFSLVIWLSALVLCKKRIRIVSLRTLLLLSIIAILTLNGRRMILNVLVVCGFVYVVARGRAVTLFSMSNLMKAATALVVLVFFSNVYQVARSSYLQHSALGLEARKIDLIDALQNFEKTAENLKRRIAVWRFHYWIMERQLGDLTDVMDGGLMWRGGVSAVPRVLYPEKSLVQEEVVMGKQHRVGLDRQPVGVIGGGVDADERGGVDICAVCQARSRASPGPHS